MKRLDVLLVEKGFFASRERAQVAIRAGLVRVDGRVREKPGEKFPPAVRIEVAGDPIPYVGRGGLKLAAALDHFRIDVTGLAALDVGASTGGFTDCLLRRGAARVYAVDVGHGQLAEPLRGDPRVVNLEGTDVRALDRVLVPSPIGIAVADVSFISLTKILPYVDELVAPGGTVIGLIKPQFEAGPDRVGKGGLVKDPAARREAVELILGAAVSLGLTCRGTIESPIRGGDGNVEYLACWIRRRKEMAAPQSNN